MHKSGGIHRVNIEHLQGVHQIVEIIILHNAIDVYKSRMSRYMRRSNNRFSILNGEKVLGFLNHGMEFGGVLTIKFVQQTEWVIEVDMLIDLMSLEWRKARI